MPIVRDEIDYIDPQSKRIIYQSGREAPLSEEASFSLFADASQKRTKEGVYQSEMDWYENGIIPKSATAFTKGFADNSALSRIATDYLLDPISAGFGALSVREGQEDKSFWNRLSDNYFAQRMGRREANREIESKHPTAYSRGEWAGLGADLFTPLKMKSPIATGAFFGAGSSDRSLFEDPEKFIKSTAMGTGIGLGLGKIGSKIERVATERAALRQFQKYEAEAQKAYEKSFQNFERLQKEADSAYQKALDNFGKTEVEAQKAYQENLQKYESLKAQSEIAYQESVNAFKDRMVGKIQAMQKDLGPYGIPKQSIDLDRFISENIGLTTQAGTKEATEATNFLRSINEALPETMTSEDVGRLFSAVEEKMLQGGEFSAPLMHSFKEHLLERLPLGAAQNKLMGKILPRVEKQVIQTVEKFIDKIPKNIVNEIEKEFGKGSIVSWKNEITKNISQQIKGGSPEELLSLFSQKESSPLLNAIRDTDLYQTVIDLPSYKAAKATQGMPASVRDRVMNSLPSSTFEAQTRFQKMGTDLDNAIRQILSKQELESRILLDETHKKITSRLSNATGLPNPNTGKMATNAPVAPYLAPEAPIQPTAGTPPAKPMPLEPPAPFVPGTPPETGRMARSFETEPLKVKEKGVFAAGALGMGKLLGVPGLGKMAAGIQGGKLAVEGFLRGITDPGAIASYSRKMAADQGLRFAVESISSYPSYQNGILLDPNDRVQAFAEIESDGSLPLEDKAVLQAYINRGKNLESLIGG